VSADGWPEPFTELLASLVDGAADGEGERLDLLTGRVARLCGADAAAIVVHLVTRGETVHTASAPLAERTVALELRDGEGPIAESQMTGRLVVVADLQREPRWPAVVAGFAALGVGSLVAVPLALGSLQLGALVLVGDRPCGYTPDQLDRIIHVADAATQLVIGLQQDGDGNGDHLGAAFTSPADRSAVVHQAVGMIAVQLGCQLDEGLVRLRARAYATDRTLSDVATTVVGRDLRFVR
jgi:hypothetical protein